MITSEEFVEFWQDSDEAAFHSFCQHLAETLSACLSDRIAPASSIPPAESLVVDVDLCAAPGKASMTFGPSVPNLRQAAEQCLSESQTAFVNRPNTGPFETRIRLLFNTNGRVSASAHELTRRTQKFFGPIARQLQEWLSFEKAASAVRKVVRKKSVLVGIIYANSGIFEVQVVRSSGTSEVDDEITNVVSEQLTTLGPLPPELTNTTKALLEFELLEGDLTVHLYSFAADRLPPRERKGSAPLTTDPIDA